MDATHHFRTALQRFIAAQHLSASELRASGSETACLAAPRGRACASLSDLYRAARRVAVVDIAGVDDLWRLPAVIKGDYLRVGPEKYVDAALRCGAVGFPDY